MKTIDLINDNCCFITKRQTTFLEFVEKETNKKYRITYQNKVEFSIDNLEFSSIKILDKHPLLIHYNSSFTNIYISSKFYNSEFLIERISSEIETHFVGWRSAEDYCNTESGLANILKTGSGLFYFGPPSGAELIKGILAEFSISHSSTFIGVPVQSNLKVLFLGNNYIVAEEFILNEIV